MSDFNLQNGRITADKRQVQFDVPDSSDRTHARRLGMQIVHEVGIGSVNHVTRNGAGCSIVFDADNPGALLDQINEHLGQNKGR